MAHHYAYHQNGIRTGSIVIFGNKMARDKWVAQNHVVSRTVSCREASKLLSAGVPAYVGMHNERTGQFKITS